MNTLALTAGSTLQLSKIFPQVQHIGRFDLKADVAQSMLDDAEEHLAVMAIPYVLALHEDYMLHCSGMLVSVGLMSSTVRRNLTAKTMHEKFAAAAGATFNASSLELFHLLRTMRNSQIHEGGLANVELHLVRGSASLPAEEVWQQLTGAPPPPFTVGDPVAFGQSEVVACFAVTDYLAEEANQILQAAVPKSHWAQMLIADVLAEGIDLTGNPNQRFRKLKAFGRRYFDAVAIPDADLRIAAIAAGMSV